MANRKYSSRRKPVNEDRRPAGRRSGASAENAPEKEAGSRMPDNLLIGRNPVTEALKSGRGIDRLLMVKGAEGSAIKIEGMAREKRIEIQYVRRSALDRITDGAAHQGVAAYVSDYKYAEVEDILAKAGEKGEAPFLVLLDGIEDPHNLGAIIRTADAAGAHGIVIPKRRAVAVTPTVEKAAAGAAEYASIARVTNIGRTIEELKEKGIWTAAADMSGASVWESDLSGPIAIVIGNEGHGISRLVREKCDFTVSLPMLGNINSLNASNAAALLMYEVVRQRTQRN